MQDATGDVELALSTYQEEEYGMAIVRGRTRVRAHSFVEATPELIAVGRVGGVGVLCLGVCACLWPCFRVL